MMCVSGCNAGSNLAASAGIIGTPGQAAPQALPLVPHRFVVPLEQDLLGIGKREKDHRFTVRRGDVIGQAHHRVSVHA